MELLGALLKLKQCEAIRRVRPLLSGTTSCFLDELETLFTDVALFAVPSEVICVLKIEESERTLYRGV